MNLTTWMRVISLFVIAVGNFKMCDTVIFQAEEKTYNCKVLVEE